MAASFFYLSRYPRVYQRLSEEVRSTFGQASEIKSGKTLSSCTYLRAFLEECLRMSPPVGTTLWREAPADSKNSPVVVDGYSIPPGTQIGVNVYALHHNEEYFPEPFAFKPERWLAEENEFSAEKKKLMNYAFSPFSIGARACAGKAMAYLEPSLVLSKTLWYFDFERASDDVQSGEDLVFRTGDQLGSRHAGPKLRFRARGEAWKELFGEK
jgi:cytochrome P450